MKDRHLLLVAIVLVFTAISSRGQNFAGEYADKSFMNGQGVFQMSLEQSGNTVSVWFSTSYNDGHGCGPEAEGSGKATGKGKVDFNFHDSSKNTGTGTITSTSDGVAVSLKLNRVADQQCLELYRQNIRLKRVSKK